MLDLNLTNVSSELFGLGGNAPAKRKSWVLELPEGSNGIGDNWHYVLLDIITHQNLFSPEGFMLIADILRRWPEFYLGLYKHWCSSHSQADPEIVKKNWWCGRISWDGNARGGDAVVYLWFTPGYEVSKDGKSYPVWGSLVGFKGGKAVVTKPNEFINTAEFIKGADLAQFDPRAPIKLSGKAELTLVQ